MAKSKSGYCAAIDKLPWIRGSVLKIVMGIVWIFAGAAIFWIIDIICVIICGKVTVLA